MAVNGTAGASGTTQPPFENLLQGAADGYIPIDGFGNDVSQTALNTIGLISNVMTNFSDQVYQAAAGGQTIISLGSKQVDIATSDGAAEMQRYFMALKTASATVARFVSAEEKEQKTVIESLR
jgi:hypothetical protein